MMTLNKIAILGTACVVLGQPAFAHERDEEREAVRENNHKVLTLPSATQAPLWPPAEVMDKDGNFVVVGTVLREGPDGMVQPTIGAAIVSSETIPPLNSAGKEDFSNPMGAPFKVIKDLDLSEGSPDRDIELYTLSFGPSLGAFGGGGRIPMEGKSTYNLNSLPDVCPEIFPSGSQAHTYTRKSYPLHKAPVLGFQGDQVSYNVDTGLSYDPYQKSGDGCGPGCSGENDVDSYLSKKAVTLGQWLDASATVKIKLGNWHQPKGHYTSARFTVDLRDAVPNGLYTVWLPRANVASNQGQPEYRQPTPSGLPNVILTDERGNGSSSFEVQNPFPSPAADEAGIRVVGMAIDFHSDYQNWGACFSRLGAGVDIRAQFVSFADGTMDFTDFVTTKKTKRVVDPVLLFRIRWGVQRTPD